MNRTTLLINEFLQTKDIVIAGVSRNPKKFGNSVFELFRHKGFNVFPINPEAEEINGITCYKSINDIPSNGKNLLIVTPQIATEGIMKDAIKKGYERIWIQQKSETPNVIKMAKDNNIKLIKDRCVFMFLEPEGGHAFHRFIFKLFGKI